MEKTKAPILEIKMMNNIIWKKRILFIISTFMYFYGISLILPNTWITAAGATLILFALRINIYEMYFGEK